MGDNSRTNHIDDEPEGEEQEGEVIELLVPESNCERLDQFVSSALTTLSRSRIQKLIEDGQILVNSKNARAGQKLKGGERIFVTMPPIAELDLQPENIALDIVYQDEHLAVINKPVNMVVHPGAGVTSGTLVHALLYHMRDSLSGVSGVARPGIVHRLDKDTSGLIMVAKNDRAHHSLAAQIQEKTARRRYLALVEGVMPMDVGTIDKPIGRHQSKRNRMALSATGRRAVSHFQVLKRFQQFTLVQVDLETGRTHQIRVHMASLGFPVVGDLLYNQKSTGNLAARERLGLNGQALHAAALSFAHPIDERLLEFEAPLPVEFAALLETLS
ncbi:MAG TPA: RluA family pseudouridine synthase [Chroococcales cyanobacterium]